MTTTPERPKRAASPPAAPTKRAPIVGWLVPQTGPIQMQRDVLVDDYEEQDFLMIYDAWRRDELEELASKDYNVLIMANGWCVAFDGRLDLHPNESMVPFLGKMCAIACGPVAVFRREESSNCVRPLPCIHSLSECPSFISALTHFSTVSH
jgi:hypothetical protein